MAIEDRGKNTKSDKQGASPSQRPDDRLSRSALGEALRANLRKRKAQARARRDDSGGDDARAGELKDD